MTRKLKMLIGICACYFLIVHSAYYWERYFEGWNLLFSIVLGISFLVLGIVWLRLVFLLFKERMANKSRVVVVAVLMAVLASVLFIRTDQFLDDRVGEDWLVAGHEGAANCTSKYRFRTNGRFTELGVCFDISRNAGNYTVKGDTLFLTYDHAHRQNYDYALILRDSLFHNKLDKPILLLMSRKDTGIQAPYGISVWDTLQPRPAP
ncbi:hypothetical protein [Paraflavitalea sp. CAU 1676]|uniref:hypothetical protein n=1 Tax=Paraflavitalea sp. CAU 1676 TaxID=3032598 RepID=UPI0023DCE942|nr:hypothetical protein [Paraflavitalea sp. CAU 1676]MDF2187854.1 hypothetical protein [Paraflavitalea sp. CAU 1676]